MRAVDILNYTSQFKNLDADPVEYNDNIFYNDSILHAAIVTTELLDKALLENKLVVNMYCGKFSLFRDEAKGKIDSVKEGCSTDGLNEQQKNAWNNLDPYKNLIGKLESFLNSKNGGTLNIVIERELESLKKCRVWDTLRDGMKNGRVTLSVLNEPLGLNHYTVTEEAYRIESSDEKKTATGCFKDRDNADMLNSNFRLLQRLAQPVYSN